MEGTKLEKQEKKNRKIANNKLNPDGRPGVGTEPSPLWLEASSLTASNVFNLKLHNFSAELLASYRNFESYQILFRAKTDSENTPKTFSDFFQWEFVSLSSNLHFSRLSSI